ncbi:response regulator transcription factor [Acetobacter orleanensis]|uniref:DNA-binding response regulator n=1 Tax=Acetobacter orleanensis TaxID=104099 RepID=A0A4Y3TQN6_9PROT|nr:response regulator transcription factor [Acetobacter orleanensis]KXV66697.1 two component response regulator PhoB [Acetobacter orleanensis]GAN69672.1 two component transcriptional regulator PhoB [Acetobacter orleanensis JCM 7639]GBR25715.1 two component response regulator [Acetobacter orleanensis NRIC 0473]GEB83397.1 DNA-binding response regulator [Acetobacter orleanensis]
MNDTPQTIHVLIVEDDPEICGLLQRYMQRLGYDVSTALNRAGINAVQKRRPVDLTLLDLMLPDEDGRSLCQYLRETSASRIIMVSALNDIHDRISGLDLGADDYVTKPFDLEELAARIRAVLRRPQPEASPTQPRGVQHYRFDNWLFEPAKRALYGKTGIRVALTGSETDLLLTFCQNVRRIFDRTELRTRIHGDAKNVDPRAIDLLISRLRRKLSHEGRQLELIRTIRGGGYIFDPDDRTP